MESLNLDSLIFHTSSYLYTYVFIHGKFYPDDTFLWKNNAINCTQYELRTYEIGCKINGH